jgi:hypothetical protein
MAQLPSTPPTPPTLVGEFTSSSRRTILQYYSHAAPGPFRGVLSVPAGFNQVEVLLAGSSLATDSREAPVNRARVYVQRFDYDAQTGDLEVGMAAELVTDGQGWNGEVTFVVILADDTAARS